jgi:glutamine amidotransferase
VLSLQRDVVVIDYGSGNTRSMVNALRKTVRDDQRVILSRDSVAIEQADRLVLPGVGAFAECRRKLDQSGALPSLTTAVRSGRPFLGVCVGMQILADEGHEFEVSPGLGWIHGVTRKLEFPQEYSGSRKLPHVGWTPIEPRTCQVFESVRPGDYFYFVHSFAHACRDPAEIAATATYGQTFAAAVLRGNVFGTQFHPEKSAHAGLRVLEAFCRWNP